MEVLLSILGEWGHCVWAESWEGGGHLEKGRGGRSTHHLQGYPPTHLLRVTNTAQHVCSPRSLSNGDQDVRVQS